ncbi:MAG: bile acid:sodium symporter [Desulfobacterales bacterium]|nr:bile acid:sodium symporter [Desulfobacterales bacterium]
MKKILKKYWFITGLVIVFLLTVADSTETLSGAGNWLKTHRGPDAVIILIFFISGLMLDAVQVKNGLMDVKGILIALILIFIAAPVIASILGLAPLSNGIKVGLFLVSVMPSTLSSGVVMTGAAGGNMAHALVITIISSILAVFTIPFSLGLLLNFVGGSKDVVIDKSAIMMKIAFFVLLPLCAGLGFNYFLKHLISRIGFQLQIANQFLILCMVWMGLSQSRQVIVDNTDMIGIIFILVFIFHGAMIMTAFFFTKQAGILPGKRESVIFMGGQKTLPLSVIIQVSLFPQFALALVVCVMHHIIHLMMDGYLVGRLTRKHH